MDFLGFPIVLYRDFNASTAALFAGDRGETETSLGGKEGEGQPGAVPTLRGGAGGEREPGRLASALLAEVKVPPALRLTPHPQGSLP